MHTQTPESYDFKHDILLLLKQHKYRHLAKKRDLAVGDILIQQGDQGSDIYILDAGILGVRVQNKEGVKTNIDHHDTAGTILGEMALMTGLPRTATVFAKTPSSVRCLSRTDFLTLAEENNTLMPALTKTVIPRWQRLVLVDVLENILGELEADAILALQEKISWQHLSNGEILCHEGDESDGMYIVINGRFRLKIRQSNGEEQIIGEISAGDTVGEISLITDSPRSATVFAVRETNVIKITPSLFQELLESYPSALPRLMAMLLGRQVRFLRGEKVTKLAATGIALIPASPNLPIEQFAQQLAIALQTHGKTVHLTQQIFDTQYGQEGVAQTTATDPNHLAVTAWLTAQEAQYEYILYVADPTSSEWTQRCINQSDHILLVADPASDPAPQATEQTIDHLSARLRTDLILWHPPETVMPQRTVKWLDHRSVDNHYHVKQGDKGHMARLARHLTGNAICLVLSGGGARGFAHMGVYQAMGELNIPIDFIGGASMGSLLGGGIAKGDSFDDLLELARETGNAKTLFDYTFPFTALMRSRKLSQTMQRLTGNIQIEDLWIPYFCVSANLSKAELIVHRRGPLWQAIRSSLSIPGVFTPVMNHNDIIVDGGVMNNFPVNVMADLCKSQHIIGVNASPLTLKEQPYDFEDNISGWRILLSRLNPFAKSLRAPSLAEVILRSLEINNFQQGRHSQEIVNLLIRPDVAEFGLLEFESYREAAKAGYQAAFEPLQQWKVSQND